MITKRFGITMVSPVVRNPGNERLVARRGIAICEANGYEHYTLFPGGQDACVQRLAFTVAILANLTECGYGDRWCYETHEKAIRALAEWASRDGAGEPNGWHRHPTTGRRRPNGDPNLEFIHR